MEGRHLWSTLGVNFPDFGGCLGKVSCKTFIIVTFRYIYERIVQITVRLRIRFQCLIADRYNRVNAELLVFE